MSTIQWHIGCSGFHYKEWKGIFYPDKLGAAKWFDYYCRHFNTIELNVTFYRFPQLATLQGWHARSPEGFLFAVKAPRLITHYKKFDDCAGLLRDFYGTIGEGLKEKLGFVLFQLPPQLVYSEAMLQRIAGSLDGSFANTVEFRHDSWWRPEVYQQLAQHHVSFCGISHPRLPDQVIINTPAVYYRFHGVPDLYRSAYSSSQLEETVLQLLTNKTVVSAHIYFNNTAGPAAIDNARWLINRLQ
jgi:uncharacterized protein YecE (DUF72 family)